MKSKPKTSSGDKIHPYLKQAFWQANQFWLSSLYSEESKRDFNLEAWKPCFELKPK